jgi:hypothetical protein
MHHPATKTMQPTTNDLHLIAFTEDDIVRSTLLVFKLKCLNADMATKNTTEAEMTAAIILERHYGGFIFLWMILA